MSAATGLRVGTLVAVPREHAGYNLGTVRAVDGGRALVQLTDSERASWTDAARLVPYGRQPTLGFGPDSQGRC